MTGRPPGIGETLLARASGEPVACEAQERLQRPIACGKLK